MAIKNAVLDVCARLVSCARLEWFESSHVIDFIWFFVFGHELFDRQKIEKD